MLLKTVVLISQCGRYTIIADNVNSWLLSVCCKTVVEDKFIFDNRNT